MASCDICSTEMPLDKGVAVSAERLRAMVSRGLGPPERMIALAGAAGLTREQVLDRWKRGLLQSEKSTWLLCPECAGRAAAYEPPPAATRRMDQRGRQPLAPGRTTTAPVRRPAAAAEAAAAPVAGAEPAGPPPEDWPVHRSPPMALIAMGVIVIVGVVVLGAWYLARSAPPARPGPAASATPLSATPLPTRPTALPTPTPTPDLSGVSLQLEDLPAGFIQLTDEERTQGGMTDEDLYAFWGEDYTEAQLLNPALFWTIYPGRIQLVVCYLLYPLTPFEQGMFDRTVADGTLLEFISGDIKGDDIHFASRLPDMDNFGDSSFGMTAADTDPERALRVGVAMVRRGAVLEVLYTVYTDGIQPPIGLYMLTLRFDKRVTAVLGK